MDVEQPEPGFEERSTKRWNLGPALGTGRPDPQGKEPLCLTGHDRPYGHTKDAGGALHNGEAESSGLVPAYPVCVPRCQWEEGGGGGGGGGAAGAAGGDIQDQLLRSCCTAEGSIEPASPSSMLEYWVDSDNRPGVAGCPAAVAPPVALRPCPFIPALSSVGQSLVCGPGADPCGPISSMCGPTSSAWDALGSTCRSPGCSERDPVGAAAHLHLLGESLSLIGHHLQETTKAVSVPSSVSLLLDSLLCALTPLIGLTAHIPELRSCTRHTLPSTLENISFLMPGL